MGAPIVQKGADSRNVYFPSGQQWYQLEYNAGKGFVHNQKLKYFEGGS